MDNISWFITTNIFPKLAVILFTGISLVTGAAAGAKILSSRMPDNEQESGEVAGITEGATGATGLLIPEEPEPVVRGASGPTPMATKPAAPAASAKTAVSARLQATLTPKPVRSTILPEEAEDEDEEHELEEEEHAYEDSEESEQESSEDSKEEEEKQSEDEVTRSETDVN